MDLKEVMIISEDIRVKYHALERQIHNKEWSTEEDALAFLTDAGLVGRYIMSNEGRWPSEDEKMLASKIGECVWWLAVLAERSGIDFEEAVENFLNPRAEELKKMNL
ncbi:MAG: MazG-like protein [Veillonella sp.]|uniref:MazG-like protein n=1 Tax=Veillonella sp. TaxID=1926307 RepID=UPI0025D564FF|nr:MazG-like protein [Veillonella sp.]MBS4912632.1 MazG-like protein [Veillonella sp.]